MICSTTQASCASHSYFGAGALKTVVTSFLSARARNFVCYSTIRSAPLRRTQFSKLTGICATRGWSVDVCCARIKVAIWSVSRARREFQSDEGSRCVLKCWSLSRSKSLQNLFLGQRFHLNRSYVFSQWLSIASQRFPSSSRVAARR